jgi:endonuclease YncB( thermonuclease family)
MTTPPAREPLHHEDLLTLAEAAALLPRKRGKRVHTQTVRRWASGDTYEVFHANGLKVRRSEFLAWAKRAGRLPPEPIRLVNVAMT